MAQITIYGASDDLVEIDGEHPIAEEYEPNSDGLFRAVIADEGGSPDTAILHVQFVDPGVWMVGLAPYDEDYPVPSAWNATLGNDFGRCRYSTVLTLHLPDTATLTVLDGVDPR